MPKTWEIPSKDLYNFFTEHYRIFQFHSLTVPGICGDLREISFNLIKIAIFNDILALLVFELKK